MKKILAVLFLLVLLLSNYSLCFAITEEVCESIYRVYEFCYDASDKGNYTAGQCVNAATNFYSNIKEMIPDTSTRAFAATICLMGCGDEVDGLSVKGYRRFQRDYCRGNIPQ
ncbi:MAG: hypothetical protein HQK92_00430 [Nitrospirae bacterium]|nr:hypothetical protein [Nitrospirota bacterium]